MKKINQSTIACRYAASVSLFIALLSGCAAQSSTPAPTQASLTGSAWRLVSFNSPGAAPELRPERPDQYELRFGADGRVTARFDCNRGNGEWRSEPASPNSGSLQFGSIATTRMMCPPARLNERLPRDIEAVRSYRIVDGRLHMSLVADGGIYIWEPISP